MYPPEVHRSYLTPFRFLERSSKVFREKTAIIHGEQRFTYPQFAERCYRLASALRAAGVEKGAGRPNNGKVGSVSREQVREIARIKLPDLNTWELDKAVKTVEGTARSMGIEVI